MSCDHLAWASAFSQDRTEHLPGLQLWRGALRGRGRGPAGGAMRARVRTSPANSPRSRLVFPKAPQWVRGLALRPLSPLYPLPTSRRQGGRAGAPQRL